MVSTITMDDFLSNYWLVYCMPSVTTVILLLKVDSPAVKQEQTHISCRKMRCNAITFHGAL